MFCEFCGGIEVSLAECWASAAAAIFYERNFESERFEYFHRSNADVRFVITHKCVVPKNDGASAVPQGCGGLYRWASQMPSCGRGHRPPTHVSQTICRSVHLRNGAASVVRRFQLFSPLRCAPP